MPVVELVHELGAPPTVIGHDGSSNSFQHAGFCKFIKVTGLTVDKLNNAANDR
jgi:hypothetical protein